ncbi:hypothetical protein K439DRAFT_447609 [Ramaria rubella]|nr:hypothetical protein K439DRAFT_447609 [Ramaria rubella]
MESRLSSNNMFEDPHFDDRLSKHLGGFTAASVAVARQHWVLLLVEGCIISIPAALYTGRRYQLRHSAGSLASNLTAELMRGKDTSGDATLVSRRAQMIKLIGRLGHTSESSTLNLTAELMSDPTSSEDTTLVSRQAR